MAKPNSKNRESKPRSSPLREISSTEFRSRKSALTPEENGDAAALDRAMEGTKLLALGSVFAQDKASISRVRAFARDLLEMVPGDGRKINPLPEYPVIPQDIDFPVAPITAKEINGFLTARESFLRASWDYRRRRAELGYKLQMLCEFEDQGRTAHYLIRLDDDSKTIIITDRSSIPEELIVDRG